MATTQEVIDSYQERMMSPAITQDEFDALVERIKVLRSLDLGS